MRFIDKQGAIYREKDSSIKIPCNQLQILNTPSKLFITKNPHSIEKQSEDEQNSFCVCGIYFLK